MNMTNKSYASRGMTLENLINKANQTYMQKGVAAVIKIPTSWKVLWKNYGGYRKPINAFPTEKSWLDYIGTVDGVAVTFDAKETNNKTSFPLSNIKEHQIKDMNYWNRCGGRSFLIIWFKQQNEVYLLPYETIIIAWNEAKNGGRKSIPYQLLKEKGFMVHSGEGVFLNWLKAYKECYEYEFANSKK